MKIIIIALIVVAFQLAGSAQSNKEIIKISENVELIKITDHAYMHVSYSYSPQWGRMSANGLLFCSDNQAFLFDSPWTNDQTETLLAWISDSMHLEIAGFIPNHWHDDCMGGLEFIQQQHINCYANQLTIDIAKSNGLPFPEHAFTDSLELKLGEKRILCYYLGGAHSLDNIVVWIPSEQILFPACMVKSMDANNLGNTADGDLVAYPKTLAKMLQKFSSAKIVVPGHGRYGGLELIEHTLELAGN